MAILIWSSGITTAMSLMASVSLFGLERCTTGGFLFQSSGLISCRKSRLLGNTFSSSFREVRLTWPLASTQSVSMGIGVSRCRIGSSNRPDSWQGTILQQTAHLTSRLEHMISPASLLSAKIWACMSYFDLDPTSMPKRLLAVSRLG